MLQALEVIDGFESHLSIIVEFSIGLGGFSAIVTAFLHQSGALSPVDRFRTMTMLLLVLMPAFIGFFCIGLMLELFKPDDAVRIKSGLVGATYTVLYYGLVFVLLQAVVQFIRILIGKRATGAT